MGVYDEDIATAKQLIAEAGEKVVWRQLNDKVQTGKPWNGSTDAGHVDYPDIPIVFLRNKRENQQGRRYDPVDDLSIGGYYGLMGQVKFVPSIKDIVIRAGKELRVVSVDALQPNEQIILYTVRFDD